MSPNSDNFLKSDKLNSLLSNINKPVWNILGSIFAGIGIIGIFIPLLPTTPFLLISAYCFNRGSDKMRQMFENNKLISSYIKNYREKKGMPLRAKINSIFILWFTIGVSIYLVEIDYVRILLVLVIIGVTIHILRIPTIKNS